MPADMPQYSLKMPIHDMFTRYVDHYRGNADQVDYTMTCIKEGVEYIKTNNNFFKCIPVMEKVYSLNETKIIYYRPVNGYDLEEIYKTLINSKGITSKRSLVREASLWFLEKKNIISLSREKIHLAEASLVRRNETRSEP